MFRLSTKQNRDYTGGLPPLDMFDDKNLTGKQRESLVTWYNAEKLRYEQDPTLIFDIKRENLKYCTNDTEILKQGVEAYRKQMMDTFGGLDPMERITLPSYCNLVYRSLMMEPETIAILPDNGYGKGNYSPESIVWLEFMAHTLGLDIKHARNSNECIIGKFYSFIYISLNR